MLQALRGIQVRLLALVIMLVALPATAISGVKRVKLTKPPNHRAHLVKGVRKDGKRYSHFAKCDCIFLLKSRPLDKVQRIRAILG